MASIKSATRYATSLSSSTKSDPLSSTEFSLRREPSRALTKKNGAGATPAQFNIGSMVKKLVETKKSTNFSKDTKFVVPADFLAEDYLKKNAKKGTGFGALHKKLFKGSSSGGAKRGGEESSRKALTEVKENTRTLAMMLRSERELLSLNKQQEEHIAETKLLLEEKNGEIEKLKDLCLKQREEIKSLKNSILFPEVVHSQLQELLEKQGTELIQAKQLIPSLQRQVTSLTGQLQFLAEDLAEVKANKYPVRGLKDDHFSPPRTPSYDQEERVNSMFDQEFSSGEYTTADSLNNMFLKDINPCLTPCYSKTKSRDFEVSVPRECGLYKTAMQPSRETWSKTCSTTISKSSGCCQVAEAGKGLIRAARRSDDRIYGHQMHQKLF